MLFFHPSGSELNMFNANKNGIRHSSVVHTIYTCILHYFAHLIGLFVLFLHCAKN